MSKFDKKPTAAPRGAVSTVEGPSTTRTFEGAPAHSRDAKSDLFLLAVTNMVGEDTFYEAAGERDARFRSLIHQVVAEDPAWVARFVPFLRNEMYMRSASVVMAAEYVKAGGPNGRSVIASACTRPDEPAEVLAYWTSMYGRKLPMALKRGVADAAGRLYHERSALKYDGGSRNWRMGDVIDVVHPAPKDEVQSTLFKWLLDVRHKRVNPRGQDKLSTIQAVKAFDSVKEADRRTYLRERGLPPGVTWERLSGWLPGGMDAEAWESVIPQMGYMALLRNLRNFEQAQVRDETVAYVIGKLTDPDEVAKSMQFPFRFYSAYANVGTEMWSGALEKALDLSLGNIPSFPGSTLILIDVSASMTSGGISARSSVTPAIGAALFGSAVAKRSDKANLVVFGSTSKDVTQTLKRNSLLKLTGKLPPMGNVVGHGTQMVGALKEHYKGHDRVLIFSDMQIFPSGARGYYDYSALTMSDFKEVKRIYGFNLQGYAPAAFETGKDNRYELGGLNDKTFKMIELLEKGHDAGWPF